MGPQTANNPLQSVSITVTLNSADTEVPYDVTNISGTATFANSTTVPISGWAKENLGTPRAGGSDLTLLVQDSAYASYPAGTTVQISAWIMTFLPRPGTAQPSPMGTRVLSSTQAFGGVNGLYTLVAPSQSGNRNLLQLTGDWDWSLMVQMQITDASGNVTFKTFVSDPEMEMES